MNRKSIGMMAALVLLVAGIWWVSARKRQKTGKMVIKPETIIESVDPFLPIELKEAGGNKLGWFRNGNENGNRKDVG